MTDLIVCSMKASSLRAGVISTYERSGVPISASSESDFFCAVCIFLLESYVFCIGILDTDV
jgi:hypothetical protein